jgi:hypothetical protein
MHTISTHNQASHRQAASCTMLLLYYQLTINHSIVRLHEFLLSNATKVIVLSHVKQQQEYDDIHITAVT